MIKDSLLRLPRWCKRVGTRKAEEAARGGKRVRLERVNMYAIGMPRFYVLRRVSNSRRPAEPRGKAQEKREQEPHTLRNRLCLLTHLLSCLLLRATSNQVHSMIERTNSEVRLLLYRSTEVLFYIDAGRVCLRRHKYSDRSCHIFRVWGQNL